MYGPVFDNKIEEWRKLQNEEAQLLFQKPCIYSYSEIAKRRLMWL